MKKFEPELYFCGICNGKMKSAWQGQFVRCECGESFVDQTNYYYRWGGKATPISRLILKDLAKISGLGYSSKDVLAEIRGWYSTLTIPEKRLSRAIEAQYNQKMNSLGGKSLRDLAEDSRGHEAIEYILAAKGE